MDTMTFGRVALSSTRTSIAWVKRWGYRVTYSGILAVICALVVIKSIPTRLQSGKRLYDTRQTNQLPPYIPVQLCRDEGRGMRGARASNRGTRASTRHRPYYGRLRTLGWAWGQRNVAFPSPSNFTLCVIRQHS